MGPDSVEVSAATEGHAVRITVADRGTGFPPEEQPYIFDPFFRGQHAIAEQIHGTGLGAASCKTDRGSAWREHSRGERCGDWNRVHLYHPSRAAGGPE